MGAMTNKNPVGRPPSTDGDTSHLHIRCRPADKVQWVKSAQGQGGLSAWVKRILSDASNKG